MRLKCPSVPSQDSERSVLYLCVSILPVSTILIFYFGIAPKVLYYLKIKTSHIEVNYFNNILQL